MRRILLTLVVLLVPALTLAAPARAGGWAVTFMDPAPADVQPHTTYTLGFWLLQHGTHPYEGVNLGEVGLKFTDGSKVVRFSGVELSEPAHYAAAISLPPGTWKVEGIQGWFAPYGIGTLTVPGRLKIAPIPEDLRRAIDSQTPQENYWGEVHPPGFKAGSGSGRPVASPPPAASPSPSPSPSPSAALSAPDGSTGSTITATVTEPGSWWHPAYAVAALLALALIGTLTYRVRRR
ncbi:hypothetical protein [Streptosporangium sp. NPDC087985]|uniref:hypothetical protein n=1 Tax=Streptosporangium sp. NPDC087985 TaxID=3366196 RepID=UPI0037FA1EC7